MGTGRGSTKEEAIKAAITNQYPDKEISIGNFNPEDPNIYGVTVHFPKDDERKLVRVEVMRSSTEWTAEIQ